MLVATLIVGVLVGVAPALGPRFTGTLSPFPVYATILTVFAHRGQGAPAAIGVQRGLLAGLFGFVRFFVVVAGSIERVGVGVGFIVATVVALTAQLVSLRGLRAGCRELAASRGAAQAARERPAVRPRAGADRAGRAARRPGR